MFLKLKKAVFLFAVFFLVLPIFCQKAQADGGVLPRPNYVVNETSQKAVILYENGQETMVVSTNFEGNAKDFAWILPVPAQPTIAKSVNDLFVSLRDLTSSQSQPHDMFTFGALSSQKSEQQGVSVIEQKSVGPYDTVTLSSNNAKALSDWLKQNGYSYPNEYTDLFEEYINKNWFFVAAKINPEKLTSLVSEKVVEGTITPLKLTFKTDKIVFPFKISSIVNSEKASITPTPTPTVEAQASPMAVAQQATPTASAQPKKTVKEMLVTLYVFSDHKMQLAGFSTDYAGWLKKTEIEKLSNNENGEPALQPTSSKLYLTAIDRSYNISEIDSDLYPEPAANDNPVGTGSSQNTATKTLTYLMIFLIVFAAILLSPFGIILVVTTIIQFLTKSRTSQIICWVLQVFTTVALIATFCLVWLVNKYTFESQVIVGFSTAIAFVLAMILVMILQVRHQRQDSRSIKSKPVEKVGDEIFQVKRKRKK